jgi:HD-GYP domain-containing protein (c-di-GMP phosphodiesterase class II)
MKTLSIKKLLFNLSSILELGEEITSDMEFKEIIKDSLYMILGSLSILNGAILYLKEGGEKFRVLTSKGIMNSPEDVVIQLDRSLFEKLKREVIPVKFSRVKAHIKGDIYQLNPYILVPLVVRGKLIGILSLGKKFGGKRYSKRDILLSLIMARHLSIFIYNNNIFKELNKKIEENKMLYVEMENIYNDTLKALAAVIDAKDPYTRGHSERVAKYASLIGEELKLTPEDINSIRIASYLHDIGKISIDNTVLLKPTKLTDDEIKIIRKHPQTSYEILSNVKFPYKDIPLLTLHHHESIDGSGYPYGIKGDDMTMGMKIIALADTFDAMTSDRPYRKALSLQSAIKEIKDYIYKRFDKNVVVAFLNLLRKDIDGELQNNGIRPYLQVDINNSVINFIDNTINDLI